MSKIIKKATEIFKSWKIAFNPDDVHAELAAKRIEICDSCEFKAETPVKHCTVCGCALKGKIHSPNQGACPKGKWDSVDREVLGKLDQ
jgi:hypothetical protein